MQVLLSNTDSITKLKIKDLLRENDSTLIINEVTSNAKNILVSNKIIIEYSNLIKAFEGFKFKI